MSNLRTHVIIPEQLIAQMAALHAATGAWNLSDHPELKGGAVAYLRAVKAPLSALLFSDAAADTSASSASTHR